MTAKVSLIFLLTLCILYSFVEYDTIADTHEEKELLSQYKENINSAVQAQFNDIVDEVGVPSLAFIYNMTVNVGF